MKGSWSSTGGLGGQPLWDMVLIPASSLQQTRTSCAPSYIIVRRPPSSCGHHKSHSIQPVHGQGDILIFLDRMHLLFTQVHFLFWQVGRIGGQYTTFRPKALENAEYRFIAITSTSTLARRGSTWLGPIYRSNRTVWHLNCTYTKVNC